MKSRKISASARRPRRPGIRIALMLGHTPEDGLGRQPDAEAIRDGGLDAAGEGDDIARLGAVASHDRERVLRREPDRPLGPAPRVTGALDSATRPKASPGRPAAASAASRVAGA